MAEGTVEVRLRLSAEEAKQALQQFGDKVSLVGGQAKKTETEIERLGRTADDTSDTASRLSQAFGTVSPQMQAAVTVVADLADGFRGATEVSEALGVSLGSVLLGGGALIAVLGGLAVAVAAVSREQELAIALTETQHGVNQALLDVERQLRDAELDRQVALGRLTEAQAEQVRAQNAARDAVLDYAESQRQERQDIEASIRSAETWLGILQRTGAVLSALADPLGITTAISDKVRELAEGALGVDLPNGLTGVIDAAAGFSDTIDTGTKRLAAMDDGIERVAEGQKKLKDVTVETTKAIEAQETAIKGLTLDERLSIYNAVFGSPEGRNAFEGLSGILDQTIKELEALEVQFQLQVDAEAMSKKLEGVSEAFSRAVSDHLAGKLNALGSSSVSTMLTAFGGPWGSLMGAGFDFVSGFSDRQNSTTDQLTEELKAFGEGLGNLGAELVEFLTKGLLQDVIPALVGGALKLIPNLFAEIIKTLGSVEFWKDVGKAFIEAILSALNPFDGLFQGGGGSAAQTSATAYSPSQFGLSTPGGTTSRTATSSASSSRMDADGEGVVFRVSWNDFLRAQAAGGARGSFRNG